MNISIMDGGMLYELNKCNNDVGENTVITNPNIVKQIHSQYINIGCEYITTANYGFKPRRQQQWKELTINARNILYSLKTDTNIKPFTMLASIPPFYESYNDGEITPEFIDFYKTLIDIFEPYTDQYLIETAISIEHIKTIVNIIRQTSKKPIMVSIYPNKNITKDNIYLLPNVDGILVNCCSFDKMITFFDTVPKIYFKDKMIGFYCNKIDEEKYNALTESAKLCPTLEKYKIDDIVTKQNIEQFINMCGGRSKIIIGGCCGYGVEEMKVLINHIMELN